MRAFNSTAPNLNWAVNKLNHAYNGLFSTLIKLIHGAGAIAEAENVEESVTWAIDIANDDSHGYSWPKGLDLAITIAQGLLEAHLRGAVSLP